jgi:PKD repeat protein
LSSTWLKGLGNGNISTLKNPVAIYSSAGTYNVKLTVSDGVFSDTKIEWAYIEVYANPITNIDIALSNIGCIPHTVDFLDNTASPAPIVSHFWDFGDGNTSIATNPTHTYSS